MQKLNNKGKTIDVSKLYLFEERSHKKEKKGLVVWRVRNLEIVGFKL